MKSVKDILKMLDEAGLKVGKTQVILDIRLGNFGLKAQKVGNSYGVEDKIASKYIEARKAKK